MMFKNPRKKRILFLFVILGLLFAGILWYRGGWYSALRSQGLKSSQMTVLYSTRDSAGTRICLLTNYGENEDPVLVEMTRERWGLWKAAKPSRKAFADNYDYWGSKSYLPEKPLTIERELHLYYCGNDATSMIETLVDVLPGGVAASIRQVGNHYLIHFVEYGDTSNFSILTLDPEELLKQKGYISDSVR